MVKKQETLATLHDWGLIAVIRGPSPELTIQMVEALAAGGVRAIEITYSTPKAEEVVSALNDQFGDQILLGMGTLTEPAQAAQAMQAGAKFLVSPICELALGKAMVDTGLAVMTGALSPSEVFQAYRMGADVVKIFPGSLAGPGYLKSLKGPFPYIEMMPTGGVSASNVVDWFAAGAFAVGAGSELCPTSLAKAGRFAEITQNATAFQAAVQEARQKAAQPSKGANG